jgi:hypothetical protein
MARAIVTANPDRRPTFEPLYDVDPRAGATFEVFYADRVLAQSFGARGAGWLYWTCEHGGVPGPVSRLFGTAFAAYRDALGGSQPFGSRTSIKSHDPQRHCGHSADMALLR